MTILLLVLAATLAGFVDAAVGGGGLIQLPALMLGLPANIPITTILGTNKAVSVTGTTLASIQFLRSGALRWQDLLWPVLAAMAGAVLGVRSAYLLEGRCLLYVRPIMVMLLISMLLFTVLKPDLGKIHAPRFGQAHQRVLAACIALGIGFYDGIFGPGTGSLLIFLFVAVLGFDFLRASALAKSVNWASNAASIAFFVSQGSWLPLVAIPMAVGNALGGYLGARAAITRGSRWMRVLFIIVVSALILRMGWQIAG